MQTPVDIATGTRLAPRISHYAAFGGQFGRGRETVTQIVGVAMDASFTIGVMVRQT